VLLVAVLSRLRPGAPSFALLGPGGQGAHRPEAWSPAEWLEPWDGALAVTAWEGSGPGELWLQVGGLGMKYVSSVDTAQSMSRLET
jgi:hypothetical protein